MYTPICLSGNFDDDHAVLIGDHVSIPNDHVIMKPPCASLCARAQSGCEPIMRQYGFEWPERMRCDRLPQDHCLDVNFVKTVDDLAELGFELSQHAVTGEV